MRFLFVSIFMLLFFIGCGGGSSSTTSITGGGGSSNNTPTIKKGIFVDSPVYGLYYKTATQSGYTDDKGEFTYIDGETIEFKLGNLSFGSVRGGDLVTPYTLSNDTNSDTPSDNTINMAILLQSLDSNRSDSILDIRKLKDVNFSDITLNTTPEDLGVKVTTFLSNNINIGDMSFRTSMSADDAKTNLRDYVVFADKSLIDPKRSNQWHIDSLGLSNIYGKSNAKTYIQIVDDGFDSGHEDLKENYDENRSWNFGTNKNDPTSASDELSHGTKVAGIIGARGFNGVGIRGIVPYGKISGYTYLGEDINGTSIGGIENLEKAWFSGDNANDIMVSNNSWGYSIESYYDNEEILEQGATLLRNGKGRVYVFAAGNDRVDTDTSTKKLYGNSNLSNTANGPYSIAVAGVGYNGKFASYSSPGSNILVSGYTNDITTTNKGNSYTNYFNGTSAATPMVSGILGLVLENCPDLSYRDVKYLLATTSKRTDTTNSTWVKNYANLWHSTDYGYGIIDGEKMINSCKSNYTLLPDEIQIKSDTFWADFVDKKVINDGSNVTLSLDVVDNNITKTEWIGVYIDFNHHRPADLQILLTSPNGTKTELLNSENALDESEGYYQKYVSFRLSSQAFYNENPKGIWKLEFKDNKLNGKNGDIIYAQLEVRGH